MQDETNGEGEGKQRDYKGRKTKTSLKIQLLWKKKEQRVSGETKEKNTLAE